MFRIEKALLAQALDAVSPYVDRHIPILRCVRVSVEGSVLEIETSNLEQSALFKTYDFTHDGNVSFCVDAVLFAKAVKGLPDGSLIGLEYSDDDRLSLSSGRISQKFPTLPSEDFPKFSIEKKNYGTTPALAFLMGVEKTIYAVSSNELDHKIGGVNVRVSGQQLTFAAFGDNRLATMMIVGSEGLSFLHNVTIPLKASQGVLRAFKGVSGDIELSGGSAVLSVSNGSLTLSTKLIDSDFVPYEKLLTQDETRRELVCNANFLLSSLGRASNFSDPKHNEIRVKLSSGSMKLESGNHAVGLSSETLMADYEDDDFDIMLSAKHILPAVSSFDDGDCCLFLPRSKTGNQVNVIICDADKRQIAVIPSLKG